MDNLDISKIDIDELSRNSEAAVLAQSVARETYLDRCWLVKIMDEYLQRSDDFSPETALLTQKLRDRGLIE